MWTTILSRSMMCFVLAFTLPDVDTSTPARQRMVLFNAECAAFVVFRLPLNTLSNAHLMTISAFDILVVECGKVVRMPLRYNAPFVSFKCLKVRWFEWYFRIRIQNHIFLKTLRTFFTHVMKWVKRSPWFLKSAMFSRGVLKNTPRRYTHVIKNDLRSFFIGGAGNRVLDFASTSFLSTCVRAPDIIL